MYLVVNDEVTSTISFTPDVVPHRMILAASGDAGPHSLTEMCLLAASRHALPLSTAFWSCFFELRIGCDMRQWWKNSSLSVISLGIDIDAHVLVDNWSRPVNYHELQALALVPCLQHSASIPGALARGLAVGLG
jgi:hypothetical protein